MKDEWVVKHSYTKEEWYEDSLDFRHGIPLDKFLFTRMRRALSDYFLKHDIPPKSGYQWFYEGASDLESEICTLILRYAPDPEERWIIKKADIPENKPESDLYKRNSDHFDHVWDYVQEHFSVADIADLRNKTEQTLKLL